MYVRYKPTILDAIELTKTTLSVLIFVEYSGIDFANVVGIKLSSAGLIVTIRFSPEGFEIIQKMLIPDLETIWEKRNYSLTYSPDVILEQMSSSAVLKRFPFFEQILDLKNYHDVSKEIETIDLFERCKVMQKRMIDLSSSSGMAHIISSLQALQRHLASEMRKPLASNFEARLDNGLSVEYQCEIYADHLYGARLLDIWHYYLLTEKQKNPENFLIWLRIQNHEILNKFGIQNIDEIPKVIYMQPEDRALWHLRIDSGNTIENQLLPFPKEENIKLEIIYVLGKSEKDSKLEFFGGLKKRGMINHSSFFAGKKVDGAGKIILKAKKNVNGHLQWYVDEINNNSGHIKPNDEMSIKTLTRLQEMGLNLATVYWNSKWGTQGAADETAAIALRRLTNHLNTIEVKQIVNAAKNTEKTSLLWEITECSTYGYLGSLYDVINMKDYLATVSDSYAIAVHIKDALLNHEKIFAFDATTPILVNILKNYAINFLRNTGSSCEEFEKCLDAILNKYKNIQTIREKYGKEVVDVELREAPIPCKKY